MNINIADTPDECAREAADWITAYAERVLQTRDRFTIALSGGSTPVALHKLLAGAPYRDRIDWKRVHVFWGDERYVPFDDEKNNARMGFETLLNHVDVPSEQIHVMDTTLPPDTSMADYGALLHRYFDGHEHTFDLVILGMGDDGHTLSLFPGTEVVNEERDWTKAFFLPQQDMFRLTITAPVVNNAAAVIFQVEGTKKADSLKEVLQGDYQPDKYPSQRIKPKTKDFVWFLDKAAASKL
ncbi:6-phosphogluconolactonase [Fibrella sp. HMF5335]|uniref:6-phosphogluconolactonase n=1 Tax=Fibrella rubiginis TaxID=2817060 RepID=A0A939K2Q6_9BACT|nr:6-phosphogluconolactonase [Fibrella rubiginis]MBO0938452.1 6-phosphogluconolactonase [Fibrella rubiginis]